MKSPSISSSRSDDSAVRPSAPTPPNCVKYRSPDEFRRTLRERVDAYFANTGRRRRDCPSMYIKSAIILSVTAALYALLVFASMAWWLVLPLAVLLGLSLAAAAFNIQHDGGHGAYSELRWVNKAASMTLDLLGGSSYVWARKHNSIHHTYTNLAGHDDDIDIGWLGRLSPEQRHFCFHRLQHVYLWVLYGFLPIKWHVYDDFRDFITGKVAGRRFPRPRGWELAIFLGGKAVFFSLAFMLPMLIHPWWCVLAVYGIASWVQGITLSVVFQMAHCVEIAAFPTPDAETGRIESSWAVHQIETTVNFAPRSRVMAWLVGGLNHQIEHHLFPQICHIHYPAMARIVEETCHEFGLRYKAFKSFLSGLASHYRWLRRMGMAQPA